MSIFKKYKNLFIIISVMIISVSCESSNSKIPYVRVDLHFNIIGELGNPALYTYTTVDGGVNGLIIYREDYNTFRVFDRTCTNYPDHNAKVIEDKDFDGVFTCPECDSKFSLSTGGSPIQGTATFSLHQYYAVVDGDLLHVYN